MLSAHKPHRHSRSRAVPLVCFVVAIVASNWTYADSSALNGSWSLEKANSQSLSDEINQLKQEHRSWESERGGINDPDKPDPFGDKRKFSEKEWNARRSGPVPNPSIVVRNMVTADTLKMHVSERIVVAYDGKVKRLINPNPNGRVHSATGKGISKDRIGETLAYFDDNAVVIETRTNSAERLAERFELTAPDELKLTIALKSPAWRRKVEFVRYFTRN